MIDMYKISEKEMSAIKIAIECFRKDELKDRYRPYSSDCEIDAGLDAFVVYCECVLNEDVEAF